MSAATLHRCPIGPVTIHAWSRSTGPRRSGGGTGLTASHAIVLRLLMATVTTTTTDLGESRVKVEVEVPATEIERELASAAGEIGRDMKVPGFRKGKVPPQVV